jgi:D-alanyl-D-alanine endopeptidase (penicillin-binding protein 7)
MKQLLLLLLILPSLALAQSITATSWLVADATGNVIRGKNTQQQRSIASITKLMTAMVVLDAQQNLEEKINQFTRRELIQLALIKSNNQASLTLCETYPGGKLSCIKAMNDKAHELGLTTTLFVEASGLSVMNVSTAEELIKIVMAASNYQEIIQDSNTDQLKIKSKNQWLTFNNTNPIIGKRYNFLVSKTGFINASGGCIVMMLDTDLGRRIVVVLGSKNTHTRIPEAEFISKKL